MSGGIVKENDTFFGLVARAAEYAAAEGRVNEKKLAKAVGVHIPTAAKLVCALRVMGVLGGKDKKYYPYTGSGTEAAAAEKRKAEYAQDYLPLVEEDKAFKPIGADGYMTGTLLPAIRIGAMYGSLSVIFLERKMSVGFERAHEIFDIIAACGLLGEEDEINPGRRKMAASLSDYDALYARLVTR